MRDIQRTPDHEEDKGDPRIFISFFLLDIPQGGDWPPTLHVIRHSVFSWRNCDLGHDTFISY